MSLVRLATAITFYHWSGIRTGNTFLPSDLKTEILPWRSGTPGPVHNILVSDPLYQFYPFLSAQLEHLKQWDWLLWSPLIYLGHPTFADPLFQTFYPLFPLAALFFGAEKGYAVGIYFHVLLAGGLTYGFFRALNFSAIAALAGALCTRSVAIW